MPARFQQMQPVLNYAATHLDAELSLTTLAHRAGMSPFHLQRTFAETTGETPKQLTLRLRLERAATLLITTQESILDIALNCGFSGHEVFNRAFRRKFAATPTHYRQRGLAPCTPNQQAAHAALVASIGPCIGLFHLTTENPSPALGRTPLMLYTIEKKTLEAQPVLCVQRRVKRTDIAATIGSTLGLVFAYAQQHGIALSGFPLTRYLDIGPGMVTLQPSMRIVGGTASETATDPDVRHETLPAGPAAVTLHTGPYDKLTEAYAALEIWIADQGLTPAAPPWEAYLNDPSEFPNPAD